MKIEKILLERIKPYERNVKRHSDEQIEKVAKSIKEYGFIQPIVVDEKNTIVIGHGRYEALKYLGEKEADVVVLKGFSKAKLSALRVADNKLNESPFDFSNLKIEMEDILKDGGIDLQDLGFTLFELEELQLSLKKQIDDGQDSLDDVSEQVEYMSNDNQQAYDFTNVQGNQNQKQPITFFCDKEEYGMLISIYGTQRKREANVDKLIEVTDFYLKNNG